MFYLVCLNCKANSTNLLVKCLCFMVLVVGEINVCPLVVRYWLTVHVHTSSYGVFSCLVRERENGNKREE